MPEKHALHTDSDTPAGFSFPQWPLSLLQLRSSTPGKVTVIDACRQHSHLMSLGGLSNRCSSMITGFLFEAGASDNPGGEEVITEPNFLVAWPTWSMSLLKLIVQCGVLVAEAALPSEPLTEVLQRGE